MLKISVVISTFSKDRQNQVFDCLESVRQQTLQPYEIFLMLDSNSNLQEFYSSRLPSGISIVEVKLPGLSNARNAGVEAASGDIVAFIDDDATADRNWLRNLVENFHDGKVAGAGGNAIAVWENGRPVWFPEELNWVVGCSYRGGPTMRSYVRNPLGCNMAFRKHVFGEVGSFKTGIGRSGKVLIGSEEAEFSIRLQALIPSAKIVHDPSAIVYHRVSKTRGSFTYLLRRSYYEGVSKALIASVYSNAVNSFFVEKQFLKYVLLVSIPERLKRIYDWRKLSELFVILASMIVVFTGYFVATLRTALTGQRYQQTLMKSGTPPMRWEIEKTQDS